MTTHRIGPAGLIGGHGRHYNPGLLRYRGRLWMCYRGHGPEALDPSLGWRVSHCVLAMVQLDPRTFTPIEHTAQWLPLSGRRTEDGRLFMHNGEPHIAYVELTKYDPGTDYACVMKYARLRLDDAGNWQVVQEWQPIYGCNTGKLREKNWQFFSHDGALWCIYMTAPKHKVLRIEGEKVVEWMDTPGPVWPWGHARGGTPPILWGEGYLSILHSSRNIERPDASWKYPETLRYHAAAYTFEAKPPFRVLEISRAPILTGSDSHGFAGDPRNPKFEDPLCVFPCGLVADPASGGYDPRLDVLCTYGVNNFQCHLARFTPADLNLGPADGSVKFLAHFKTTNPIPITVVMPVGEVPKTLHWQRPRGPVMMGMPHEGFMALTDPGEAEGLIDKPNVTRITEAEYSAALR